MKKILIAVTTVCGVAVVPLVLLLFSQAAPAQTVTITSEPAYLSISTLQLVSTRRLDRTNYEYVYRTKVSNSSSIAYSGAHASVSTDASSITIIDGDLDFGAIGSGSSTTSTDTFTIRQNRSNSSPAVLAWTVVPAAGTFTNTAAGYTATIPVQFQGLSAPGQSSVWIESTSPYISGEREHFPAISIESYANATNLSLEDFYAHQDANFFIASARQEKFSVNGMDAVRFYGAYSMAGTYVVAVRLPGKVVEISSYNENSDSDLDSIVQTLQATP